MRIGVYYYKKENESIAELVIREADRFGFSLDNKTPDIVISIGGDGTFLRCVHHYLNRLANTAFIGINSGSLGFYCDFVKEEITSLFEMISQEDYVINEHSLLCGNLEYKDGCETIYAVNEIRIENPLHTLKCSVFINDEKLESFRGNGLVISSTLGSSGYNKSLGGALVDHELEALQLTEVAPLSNNVYRTLGSPLILSPERVINIDGALSNAVVGYDHLNVQERELLSISVGYSDKKLFILTPSDKTYISKIRKSFVL